jgi:D-glutamate cyclase
MAGSGFDHQTADETLGVVADAVEMQCCVEIRPPGAMRGVVRPLCIAARKRQNGSPYLLATQALLKAAQEGRTVIIATGFPVPGVMPFGETDGPPGAASLAFALSVGLGAVPVVLGDPTTMGPIHAACHSIGLVERDFESARKAPRASVVFDIMPADEEAEAKTEDLLNTLQPSAIVVIEKPGLNDRGVAHGAGGRQITSGRGRIEVLTARARQVGIPVIAIGDNGNEAGLGLIGDAVRLHKAYGERCLCPCGGGIAAVDVADVTVVGSVSNWAAYGISACLAIALGDPRLIHDGAAEKRMIADCLRAGAVDGGTYSHRFMVDGIAAEVNAAVVEILRAIVTTSLSKV